VGDGLDGKCGVYFKQLFVTDCWESIGIRSKPCGGFGVWL